MPPLCLMVKPASGACNMRCGYCFYADETALRQEGVRPPMTEETPLRLRCPSVLLVEAESGQIIFEKNADERRAVASVTKIMSILLTVEAVEDGRPDVKRNCTLLAPGA